MGGVATTRALDTRGREGASHYSWTIFHFNWLGSLGSSGPSRFSRQVCINNAGQFLGPTTTRWLRRLSDNLINGYFYQHAGIWNLCAPINRHLCGRGVCNARTDILARRDNESLTVGKAIGVDWLRRCGASNDDMLADGPPAGRMSSERSTGRPKETGETASGVWLGY